MTNRRTLPLSLRLVVLYGMLIAASLLVVSGLVLYLTRVHLTAELDADIRSSERSFASGPARSVTNPKDLTTASREWLSLRAIPRDQLAAIRTKQGIFTQQGALDLDDYLGGRDLLSATSSGWHRLEGANASLRALTVPLMLDGRQAGTLVVGASEAGIDETLSALLRGTAVASLAGLLLAALLGFFTVRRTLRPLAQISDQAKAIEETGDLERRVVYEGPRDEVGNLAIAFDHMMDRLQEAFASQQRFLADASHELRTPMTVVRGQLELLQQELTGEQGRRSVTIGLDELDRMSRIVEDLLLLARLDEGMELKSDPVEVELLLQEAMLRGMALGPRDIKVDADPALFVRADPDRLLQVVSNLVSNALQHAGEDATVFLSARREGSSIAIDVRDTGRGIGPDDIDRVFDRLYRGSMPRTDAPGGAGLGLAIASSLTEAMGGEIRVTSTLGLGTTFTITFPSTNAGPVAAPNSKESVAPPR
ncbi:MAG: two-component system, OmpR family, sensor kinase [Actinomycetota bacterium]|nr:two-component system, OmpR family, sensor kinase [Actinomycetota bacterium]